MVPELRLLGGAALLAATGELVAGAAAQPRRLAVLAVLAEAWPSAVTRDRIVGLLWPEHDGPAARRLLSQALYALRREIGDAIVAAGRDLAIDAAALRVDLIEFRRRLDQADPEGAVALHRGPPLDGFYLRDALEFERWVDGVRDDVRRRNQQALEALVARCAAAGLARDAARWGERLAQAVPYDAAAAAQLVALWERAGDPGAALAAAASYERRLRDELGVEPDPAVRRATEALRAPSPTPGAPTATTAAPPSAEPPAEPAAPPSVAAPAERGPEPPTPAPRVAVPTPRRSRPVVAVAAPRRGLMRHALTWAIVVLAVGTAGGSLTAAHSTRAAAHAPASEAARVLVLLPLEVRGDAGAAASLDSAVTGMLVAGLDGADGVRIERGARVGRGPATTRDSRWASLRAVAVVAGGQLRLDVELRPTDPAAPPARASVSGPRDSLIVLADRLVLALLPSLYPRAEAPGVRRPAFTRVAALRRFLDGEAALRRGAFDQAHDALRQATEADGAPAYAWYRRAVAAELAHRADDADRSIAAAEARAAGLSLRDRLLLRGYARWRAGDALGADSILRRVVAADSRDAEAWFQLGEIAYHAGPLHGRPLDGARDVWRQVVALDSGSYPALMHLIRLEARAGDTAAVGRLLRRAAAIRADGPAAAESRVIAAYATGRAADAAAVGALLDSLPDYSLSFLQGVVAGMLERPAAARDIAGRLTGHTRPASARADGHLALARLLMAAGRWRQASAELDRAAPLNPAAAAWTRAQFATLPFVDAPPAALARAADELAAVPPTAVGVPLYLQLAAEAPAAPVIEAYLAAMLRLAAAAHSAAIPPADGPACDAAAPADVHALCGGLRAGLAAEAARRAGDHRAALAHLESSATVAPYQLAARSVYFARTRERWLRAELLERAGRDAEAERWYAAVPHGSRADVVYLAPSHLRRGRIRERRGDRAAAAAHYRRVLALWPQPDAELVGLRQEAETGLRRVTRPR